jgi:hypothetical protein
MENSLFTRPGAAPLPNPTIPPPVDANEEVLQALLSQNVGTEIRQDASVGKRDLLSKLTPKTRGLKRLIRSINADEQKIVVRGADEAVDMLEVMLDIVNGAFVVQEGAPQHLGQPSGESEV